MQSHKSIQDVKQGGEGSDTAQVLLGPSSAQPKDTGLIALAGIALQFQVRVDWVAIGHELALGGRKATDADIVRAASLIGLDARLLRNQNTARLVSVPRPAILRMREGNCVILARNLGSKHEVYYKQEERAPRLMTLEEITEDWAGNIILVRRSSLKSEVAPDAFGVRWFFPAIWRFRAPLAQVLFASLFVQLFALVTPMFFQVIIDKVLVHNSVATLDVVVVGLAALGIFDMVLQYLRTYALSHTASRLDVEFGSRLVAHLFKLPLGYFETRSTGQSVARVREIETIRNFLTGQGVTSLIDVLFTAVFFAVLLYYSWKLTLVVALSIPLYVGIATVIRPVLRAKIAEKFFRNADSQQFLVESIVGAYTIKAAAVEPLVQAQWEEKLGTYVKTAFQATMLTTLGQNSIQYVSKLTTAVLLFFGANEVMAGDMTVGSFIAFYMISNQLVAPLLRISQLWQDFQQIQISVDRLGDIVRSPLEPQPASLANLPAMKGTIDFKSVYFRYDQNADDVVRDLTLSVPAGQVIGIVGPSGSGKSTLTKLLQRLYIPQRGSVCVDGIELAKVHTAWLRRQIGVVLQENLLFNRSIHDNIALATPFMSRQEVVAISRLAGADEFISKLANGYDTWIQERGANLSGGQRQRIAIARALTRNPRILIFDEATSALDYESERVIQNNMKAIASGRTVIIIAHRLAAVRHCDRIVGIVDGEILEDGSHDELLKRPDGLYRRLWAMQGETGAT